jgi:hypothetical protein
MRAEIDHNVTNANVVIPTKLVRLVQAPSVRPKISLKQTVDQTCYYLWLHAANQDAEAKVFKSARLVSTNSELFS